MTSEKEKQKAPPKVTAFELDPATVGDNDSHGYTFGGFPGVWQVGRPVLPAALGLTLEGMRDLVVKFQLPLVEVKVAESKAHDTFEVPAQMIESGPQVQEPVQTQPELLEVRGELIPGPTTPPQHPPLQPFAAEMIARDTARLYPGDVAEDIVADLPVEEGSEAEQAALDAAAEAEGAGS